MDLKTLLTIIVDSRSEDWNFVSGDTFHSTFGREGPPDQLHAYSHNAAAVYIPDVSISMEWGIVWKDDYEAPWVHQFPDPRATGVFLDIFYNHSLSYRLPFVLVDGNKMPLPNNIKDLKVSKGDCNLLKIVDRMGSAPRPNHRSYETDLRVAGFHVVADEWPKFRH